MSTTAIKTSKELWSHWIEIFEPLDELLPLLDGALHYTPSALVSSTAERGERLDEGGALFAELVHRRAGKALRAAWDVVGRVAPTSDQKVFLRATEAARKRLHDVFLISRALLEDAEFPREVSAHDALARIQEHVKAVHETLQEVEPPFRTE